MLFGCFAACGKDLPAVVEQVFFISSLLKRGKYQLPQGSIR